MKNLKMTYKILGVCLVLNVLCSLIPGLMDALAFMPNSWLAPLTLITHMFSHAGWDHLIGNFMFGLPFMVYLEKKIGPIMLLHSYVLCGLGGVALNTVAMWPAAGCIGSSAALMGIAVMACLHYGTTKADHALGLLFAAMLILPQILQAPSEMFVGVAFYGHLGGAFAALALCARLIPPAPVTAHESLPKRNRPH